MIEVDQVLRVAPALMEAAANKSRSMKRTAIACSTIVLGMVGAAYAAVPLYELFCLSALTETPRASFSLQGLSIG